MNKSLYLETRSFLLCLTFFLCVCFVRFFFFSFCCVSYVSYVHFFFLHSTLIYMNEIIRYFTVLLLYMSSCVAQW